MTVDRWGHNLVKLTNAATGVVRYGDLSDHHFILLDEAYIGERVDVLGATYTVMDKYADCVEVSDGRHVLVVDMAVADDAEARSHLRRVA